MKGLVCRLKTELFFNSFLSLFLCLKTPNQSLNAKRFVCSFRLDPSM